MTYKLWANGTEHGPYSRAEILGQFERGELDGMLWRRVGQSKFRPHTDLAEELAESTPIPVVASDPPVKEPNGDSIGGQLAIACGIVGFLGAIVFSIAVPQMTSLGYAALVAIVVGYLARIHAKLRLIAHRLKGQERP